MRRRPPRVHGDPRGPTTTSICWHSRTPSGVALAGGQYEATKVAVPLYSATTQMALHIRNEQVVTLESVISGVSGDE